MNRTRALAPCTGNAWHGRLELSMSDVRLYVPVPAGPNYSVTVNITSPVFRLISDGKTPDCRPFRTALIEAVGKAAKQAGHDIAEAMSAEQKRVAAHRQQQQREEAQQQRIADRAARQGRLALIEAMKAERRARPTIRDVVLELLPGVTQSYFDVLLTEIEAEQGDLSPLLIREARGYFSIPHDDGATPLGTLTVREFQRPPWRFNKIITIEKNDLRLMLQQAGWDRRHDALLMSAVGFNTRAARDLIDKIAETSEPLSVYSVHDADSAGTLIHHTLQHATLARAARKIEIIDLGLQPWEGVTLGLAIEKVPVRYTKDGAPMRRPVGEYVRERTDRAPTGETWEQWLQHSRVELNAFTSAEMIYWLDRKMAEAGVGKVIPPHNILQDKFAERLRGRAQDAVMEAIDQRLHEQIAVIEAEQAEATKDIQADIDRITANLRKQLAELAEPFQQKIKAAKAAAQAIDGEAIAHLAIKRITPDADMLRTAIREAFSDRPMLPWLSLLQEIADEVGTGIKETVQAVAGDRR